MGSIAANILIPDRLSSEELHLFLIDRFESVERGNSYDDNPEWQLAGYGVYFYIILRQNPDIIYLGEIENIFGFFPQGELYIYMLGKSECFQKALTYILLNLAEKYQGIIGVNLMLPQDMCEYYIGWYNSQLFRSLCEENRIYFVS